MDTKRSGRTNQSDHGGAIGGGDDDDDDGQ